MLADIAWKGFKLSFGLVCLVNMVAVAAFQAKAFTKKERPEEKKAMLASQEKYWSLDRDPLPGFKHHFFTTRTGVKLHYVANDHSASNTRNVALFIHGFPDSFLLWRNVLKSTNLQQNILIAVDLPGYGGSDDLPFYGANEILEAIAEFILDMRSKYTPDSARKFVVVSHDWGAIIGARLASEAKQLADRWVIASGIIPQLSHSNAHARAASAKQMLHTWTRSPFNLRPLKNALLTLRPIFNQFSYSFYIFCFNLPWPLAYFFATMGKYWLLKIIHNVAAGYMTKDGKLAKRLDAQQAGDWMAMSSGPGIIQIEESKGAYPEATRRRVKDHGMGQKIRIYRDNLFLAPWEKSLETVVALSEIQESPSRSNSGNTGGGLFDDGPTGSIKAPATFIMGRQDLGFDKKLGLDGISDYIGASSQALFLNESGHWLPCESLGSKTLEIIIQWALRGEDEGQKLAEQLSGISEVEFIVDK